MFAVAGGIIIAVLFFMFFEEIIKIGAVLLVAAAVIIGIVLIVVLVQPETKPEKPSPVPQAAATVKPWEKYTQSAPPEQPKHPTLADLQALRNKVPEKPSTDALPTPTQITPQALSACVLAAANKYQIPPAVLIGIMEVEGGLVGEETKPDPTYLYFMGPMHVSNRMIPEVAQVWNVDFDTAHNWLKNDGCVNVHVAAWILTKKIAETGNLYQAIGRYHSDDSATAADYAKKVIAAMDKKGLVNHDVPLPQ